MDIPQVTSADSHESINSALANSFASNEGKFNVFSRWEANLSRAFDRTLKQLLAVRKEKLAPLNPPNQTNRNPIENIHPPPAAEPNPHENIRFYPPTDPADALNRRHGNFVPFTERPLPSVSLVWIDEHGNERMDLGGNPSEPG